MKPFVLVILASALFLLFSCNSNENLREDLTNTVNKNGAIESDLSVQHLDSLHDVLITKHQVWTNDSSSRIIEYRDTIPALGSTITTAENEEGDSKTVQVKKDYEIFITIK